MDVNRRLFRNETRLLTPGRQNFIFFDRLLPDAESDGTMRKRGPTAYKKREERVHSRLRQRPLHSNASSLSRFDEFHIERFFEQRESWRESRLKFKDTEEVESERLKQI